MKNIFTALMFLVFMMNNIVHAQTTSTFNLSVQVIAPAPTRFYDFFNVPGKILATANRMLPANDSTFSHVWITGKCTGDNGVVIETNRFYTASKTILIGPTNPVKVLTGSDLRECMAVDNIDITSNNNLTAVQLQNGFLPAGNYTFCFTLNSASMVSGSVPVSPEACSFSFEVAPSTEPPMLISPMCNADVAPLTPQQIIFTWAPVTTLQNVAYDFKLVEMEEGQDPQIAIEAFSAPVIFEKEIFNTTLVYGMANPALTAGKKYVWRVTARTNDGALIKNNGKSEVCVFNYSDANDEVKPPKGNILATNNGDAIQLISPANKSEILWHPGGPGKTPYYEFTWNVLSENSNYNCTKKLVKLNDGQTPEQAIKNNTDTYEDEKGGPNFLHKKLDPGTYAWQVTGVNNSKTISSVIFIFYVNKGDTATSDLKTFKMCGYTVTVKSISNNALNDFSGTGTVQLWQNQNSLLQQQENTGIINVQYGGLIIQNFKNDGGVKSDWRCVNGVLSADISYMNAFNLKPTAELEGDFKLKANWFQLEADMKTTFDSGLGLYYELDDKGSTCNAFVKADITWLPPLTNALANQNTNNDGENQSFSFNTPMQVKIIATDATLNISDFNNFGFSGVAPFKKEYLINLLSPKNCVLAFASSSKFYVNGKNISASLDGTFKTSTKGYDDHPLNYSFTAASSLLIAVTLETPVQFNLNKDASVNATATSAMLKLGAANPEGYSGNNYGVFQKDFTVSFNKSNVWQQVIFHNAFLNGNGFNCESVTNDAFKMNCIQFDNQTTGLDFKTSDSKLQWFNINGHLNVPFLNLTPDFELFFDGWQAYDLWIDFKKQVSVVLENGNDKILAYPNIGSITTDKIVLDVKFDVSNSANKNVTASGIFAKQMFIKADGSIGWNTNEKLDGNWKTLENNVAGSYYGFDYKIQRISIGYDGGASKKYYFNLQGSIVLEQTTLVVIPQDQFEVDLAFNTKNIFSIDENATASADENFFVPATPPSEDMMLMVSNKDLHVMNVSNGVMAFDGNFILYKDDPEFGDGFETSANVDCQSAIPFEGHVSTRVIIGKKSDYKYWFVEAAQQNVMKFATGILDVTVYGFGGRFYYHMAHVNGSNIFDNYYIPSKGNGLGVYGVIDLETEGSQGAIFWGTFGTEVTLSSSGSPLSIKQRGDAYLLSSGAGNKNGKVHGTAYMDWDFQNKSLTGGIDVKGDLYSVMSVDYYGEFKFSSGDWYVNIGTKTYPCMAYVYSIGESVGGYFDIGYDGKYTLYAGISGNLLDLHYHPCVDLEVCSGCVWADVVVNGYADVKAVYPSPQLSGAIGLTAYAGFGASLCGIGAGDSFSAGFGGNFTLPDPFCIGGYAFIDLPWPVPNINVDLRLNNGTFEFGQSSCY